MPILTRTHVVPISGGKDSTCLAVLLAEREPREYRYVFTPTGDELPPVVEHLEKLAVLLGTEIERVLFPGGLDGLISHYEALPNNRHRWCTRQLKIQPFQAWLKTALPATVYVGIRADECGRGNVYDGMADVIERHPLAEWGIDESGVWQELGERGITIPDRTDCARCYDQTLGEWWHLWKRYPAIYADAERQEAGTGHTFRSPSRDTWPADLAGLRSCFESGRVPRGTVQQIDALQGCARIKRTRCRVCTL